VTQEPDTADPLIVKITVEIITYAVYFSWLSLLAAGALYLGVPPLPTIEDAVQGPWQGTAAAIALGVASMVGMRAIFDAIRGKKPNNTEENPPTPPQARPSKPPTTVKRTKKKKKKRRRTHKG